LFGGEVIRASLWHINFIHKHVPGALTSKTQTQIDKGKQVKHKLKDDETGLDEWYSGFIVDASEDSVSIYNDYSEEFTWPLSDIREVSVTDLYSFSCIWSI